jgi:t-SNARE complex subunit (syntaxin)
MSSSKNPKDGSVPQGKSKTQEVLEQVEEVKGIMHSNIEMLVKNVDNLEVIQDKSETLKSSSQQFRSSSHTLHNKMWWRNCKLQIIIILVVLVILAAIIIAIVVPYVKNN